VHLKIAEEIRILILIEKIKKKTKRTSVQFRHDVN